MKPALKLVGGVLALILPLLGVPSADAAPKPKRTPPPTASALPAGTAVPRSSTSTALVSVDVSATLTATVPTTDACGTVLLKADGSPRTCTFVDNFTSTTLNRDKWHVQTNTPSGTDAARSCHTDSPSNVSVSGGALRLTVRKLTSTVQCAGKPARYSSGQISTFWKWSQQYGRFEARMRVKATRSPGLQEAFWLWPDARVPSTEYWPAAGEIDIIETYSLYPDLAIPFLHYTYNDNGGPWPGRNTAWDCPAQRGVWNTYALEWTATRIEIFVNGRSCLVNTTGDPAFQKPYIVAFTQALGVAGNAYTGSVPLPATTEVDYVKVWS